MYVCMYVLVLLYNVLAKRCKCCKNIVRTKGCYIEYYLVCKFYEIKSESFRFVVFLRACLAFTEDFTTSLLINTARCCEFAFGNVK